MKNNDDNYREKHMGEMVVKTHKLNTKIYEHDVKKANECHARLEKCLL